MTGVQTCALPICGTALASLMAVRSLREGLPVDLVAATSADPVAGDAA